jgi:uncharacterized membrane protein
LAESLYDAVRSLPPWLAVLLLAMVPLTELRGAIPFGVLVLKLSALEAFVFATLGNLIVVPILVLLLEPVSVWTRSRIKLVDRVLVWLFARTRRRLGPSFERIRDFALVSFVGVPLPGTGSWSGALAGFVFGVPRSRQIPLIGAGVVMAGVIVAVLVASGTALFGVIEG